MPGENLTRVEAQERKALVDGRVATTSPSTSRPGRRGLPLDDDRDASRPPGAHRPSSTRITRTVHSVTLNGADARRRRGQRRRAHPARRPRRRERAHRRRRRRLHEHRRGPAPLRRPGRRRGLPLLAVRGARQPPRLRRVRAARPQGDVPVHRHRARALAGRLQLADARAASTPAATAPPPGRSSRRRASRATSPRSSPARTRSCARELTSRDGRVIPLGIFARKSLFELPRRRLHLRHHPQGLRLLRGEVRLPVPLRQVRPALRARVQRGRHGERGRGHLHRDLRVPRRR